MNIVSHQEKNVRVRPSRNRTYIGNLEGFCPNPLDDRPLLRLGNTGFEPVTFCL